MKTLKTLILVLIISGTTTAFCQTSKLNQLLQETLQQEFKIRKIEHTVSDSIKIKQTLVVEKDTLYCIIKSDFIFKKSNNTEQQKVALKDITMVIKDVGIFFVTQPDKVIRTSTKNTHEEPQTKEVETSNLFRTHIVSLLENENLADELVKAFKVAGFSIKKGDWYD